MDYTAFNNYANIANISATTNIDDNTKKLTVAFYLQVVQADSSKLTSSLFPAALVIICSEALFT